MSKSRRRWIPSAIWPTEPWVGPTPAPSRDRRLAAAPCRNSTGSMFLSTNPSAPMNNAREIVVGSALAPHPRIAWLREPFPHRADQPEGVLLAAEAESDQDHDARAPDPADDLDRLGGGAGLGQHLHVGTVVDQQREAGAHDRQRIDEHDAESAASPSGGGASVRLSRSHRTEAMRHRDRATVVSRPSGVGRGPRSSSSIRPSWAARETACTRVRTPSLR